MLSISYSLACPCRVLVVSLPCPCRVLVVSLSCPCRVLVVSLSCPCRVLVVSLSCPCRVLVVSLSCPCRVLVVSLSCPYHQSRVSVNRTMGAPSIYVSTSVLCKIYQRTGSCDLCSKRRRYRRSLRGVCYLGHIYRCDNPWAEIARYRTSTVRPVSRRGRN